MQCRSCGTREADSKEHIFHSALGGRWEVAGILCRRCNGNFGSGIDTALIDGFRDLRVFFGIVGDRNQTPSIAKTDNLGNAVVVGARMVPKAAERAPEVVSKDGSQVTFSVASEKAARQFINSLERKGQTFTVDAVAVRTIYPGTVPMNFGFNGQEDSFRACVKTVLCLIAARGCEGSPQTFERAWQYVNGGDPAQCAVEIEFTAAPPPVKGEDVGLGLVSHRVFARSNPERGWIEADVRYFGDFGLCMRIGVPSVAPFLIGHGVDPLIGTTANFDDWNGAIGIPGAADWDEVVHYAGKARIAAIEYGNNRIDKLWLSGVVEDIIGDVCPGLVKGDPIPSDALQEILLRARQQATDRVWRVEKERQAPELKERLIAKPKEPR